MRHSLLTAMIAVSLLLGSCAGDWGNTGRIDYSRIDGAYSRRDFAYAGSGRDMTTEIYGNPFRDVAKADFDSAVTSAMAGAHFGPATNFTTTPGDTARPTYRVRMLWNGPRSASPSALCRDTPEGAGGGSESGTARLVAAFCRSDRAVTYVVGSVDDVNGPDDARFLGFVRQVTHQLFPPRDGDFDRERCFMPDC